MALVIYDSKYLKDEMKMSPEELIAKYENHKKIELDFIHIQVTDEFRISEKFDSDASYAYTFNNYFIDISNCKKVWLDNIVFSEKYIDEINKCNTLEELIITNSLCFNEFNELKLDIPTLKTLRVMFDMSLKPLKNFDLNGCENLEKLSIGNGFQTTNLDGIKNCTNIKQLDFGSLPRDTTDSLDIVEDGELSEGYDTSNKANANVYARENYIYDITAIKGSQLETIDISFLRYVTSEQLLDVVKSLPKLNKIVGNEIGNAPTCSEELISYCKEHKIEHPFTEKSLQIKNKIREIVNSTIKPEMTDQEKIKLLSIYIMKNLEYDNEIAAREADDLTKKDIKNYWGESIDYSLNKGKAICEGYAREATALFLEAKLNAFDIPLTVAEEEGHEYTPLSEQAIHNGEEAWTDLGGLLLPQALESQLVEDIIDGTTEDIESVINALSEAHSHYADFNQAYAFSLIRQLYEEATPAAFSLIETRADEAKSLWTEDIRKDAQKEYDLGDVDEDTFLHFANSISPAT